MGNKASNKVVIVNKLFYRNYQYSRNKKPKIFSRDHKIKLGFKYEPAYNYSTKYIHKVYPLGMKYNDIYTLIINKSKTNQCIDVIVYDNMENVIFNGWKFIRPKSILYVNVGQFMRKYKREKNTKPLMVRVGAGETFHYFYLKI